MIDYERHPIGRVDAEKGKPATFVYPGVGKVSGIVVDEVAEEVRGEEGVYFFVVQKLRLSKETGHAEGEHHVRFGYYKGYTKEPENEVRFRWVPRGAATMPVATARRLMRKAHEANIL